MNWSLTRVLLKVFARSFYKHHAGFLLFLFIAVISYFFFIQVLNQTHLPPDQIAPHQLILVLTMLSSPVMAGMVFSAWLVYAAKSSAYVLRQIALPVNEFLLYSSTSFQKSSQFVAWLFVQTALSIPVICYGIFVLIIGGIFHYYTVPVIVILYIAVVNISCAFLFTWGINAARGGYANSVSIRLLRNWKKPYFSLSLYHMVDRLKIPLLVTKLISWSIVAGGLAFFVDLRDNIDVSALIALGIVTTHTMLGYHSSRFENSSLAFARNLPFGVTKMYWSALIAYFALTAPENLWILVHFQPLQTTGLILFHSGMAMIFRSLLYVGGMSMKHYMYWVFYLFILCFALLLFKLFWWLVPVTFLVSILIFQRFYYRQDHLPRD